MKSEHKMKKSGWIRQIITLVILMAGLQAGAQTDVIIGAGVQSLTPTNTATGDCGPIYRSSAASAFDYSMHHHLFTAAELSSIPGGTTITKIAWYKNNASATNGNAQKLNIYLKNSGQTTTPTPPQSFATLTNGATLVYSSSSQAISSAIGWVEYTLTTPIVYTGGALEVTIDWDISNVAGNPTNLGFVWKSDPISGRVLSYVNSVAGTSFDLARTSRAQTKFTYMGGTPCTGTPTPGNTLSSASNVCAGINVTLSLQHVTSGTGVSYQWFANNMAISGATSASLTTTVAGNTDFYCDVTCTNSGLSAASAPVTVTSNCYCSPNSSGGASFYGQIQKVTFDSINKTSGYPFSSPYYTNYAPAAGTTTSVYQGFSYPITVKVGTSAQAAVWFDWNHNFAFEASEYTLLGSNFTNPTATFTATINVPINAVSGPTLMRVRAKDGLTANFTAGQSCTLSDYGESEDYTITILTPSACSGTPAPGNTVSSVVSPCAGVNFTLSTENLFFETGLTYQWYNTNGAIVGATNKQFTTSISSADSFYCMVTCTNSGLSATSNPIGLILTNYTLCYCSSASSSGGGYIKKVVFESIHNETIHPPVAPYATVFAQGLGTSANVIKGATYPLEVTAAATSKAAVWIDWDHNGMFDTYEFTWLGSNTSNADVVLMQNITVPISALSGVTRMRIRSRKSSEPDFVATNVCLTTTNGETEDYYLNVFDAMSCSGMPSPGNAISNVSSACAGSSFFLGLSNPMNGSDATYQWYSGAGAIAGATSAFYVATFVSADSFWCVVHCPSSGLSANAVSIQITANAPLACYCEPPTEYGCSNADVVAQFKLNTLDNNSGTTCTGGFNGYSDYTSNGSLTTSLQKGSVYNAQVWPGPTWGQGFAVWIDFNDNGIFEHPAERIGYTTASILGGGTEIFPVGIPCNSAEGVHRLRIRSKYATPGINITPCDYQFAGETEDYLITLTAPAGCTAPFGVMVSNVTYNSADISWTAGCFQTLWDVHVAPSGAGIPSGPPNYPNVNNPFSVSGLQPSTSYDVYVRAICDSPAATTSNWSALYSFQTTVGPCAGLPSPGTAVSDITMACPANNVANLSLTGSPSLPGITYQWYHTAGLIPGATNTTYTTQALTSSDEFYCAITCANSGLTAYSNHVVIQLGSYLTCYCIPVTSCTYPDIITNVTFAGINRTSTCDNAGSGGYSVYTTAPNTATLTQGATYPISVSTAGDLEGTAVWIDYDHSGTFDATELVLHGFAGTTPATYSGSVTVPLNALPGTTMMRVRCTYNVDPSVSVGPCNSVQYGETEDYQILINPIITTNTLSLTCFIQGYWNGAGGMVPVLANQGQAAAPTDCDTIEVSLRDAITYTLSASTKAVLQQNGTASCVFNPGVATGDYFIVVTHRNAVETWSATAVPVSASFAYDFSDSEGKAYGANQIQVSSSPDVFAFYSGDIFKDNAESIDLLDLIQMESEINAFGYGYKPEDLNGDGNVDLLDTPLMEPNINAFIYSNHP